MLFTCSFRHRSPLCGLAQVPSFLCALVAFYVKWDNKRCYLSAWSWPGAQLEKYSENVSCCLLILYPICSPSKYLQSTYYMPDELRLRYGILFRTNQLLFKMLGDL